jgi:hypothetical protein
LTVLLVVEHGVINLHLVDHGCAIYSSHTACTWATPDVALTVESAELRFVLNEVVLTVLDDDLVVEASKARHSLALWLCVFVSVLHLFLSLLHVRRAVGLYLLLQRTAQHILRVLDVEA